MQQTAGSTGIDQWYYLDGSETRGPVPAAQIVQLIKSGSLSAGTQVAQAGWQTWSPASTALQDMLGAGAAVPSPANEPLTYAIKVQCVAGPDQGKAYMISAAEVSLGRVSGLVDPQVGENHLVLSWQNNVLYFRSFAGSKVRVAGADVTQGTLSNGQQFQMGGSTWKVGNAPIELTNLLTNLGSRLNRLTATEKLEGLSLSEMFSEVFKARKSGELENYFIVGTSTTTPALDEVQTGWPKPWFFMRVLLFMAVVYFCLYQAFNIFGNDKLVPALIVFGSMVVPLAVVFLFWEMNTPRNVSFTLVLMLFLLGGVISLFISLIGFDISNLQWLGLAQAGIVEEAGKLLAVVVVARGARYKWTLNGMVFGAAIGGGFSAFETAGYAFDNGFFTSFMDFFLKNAGNGDLGEVVRNAQFVAYQQMVGLLHFRSYLAPFGHMLWTAISAGALWRVKGSQPFRFNMLVDPTFLRTFLIPVLLHMTWNSPLLRAEGILGFGRYLFLGAIGWYVAFLLIQAGLKQIRDAQLTQTRSDIQKTRDILTTTGRFRIHTTEKAT